MEDAYRSSMLKTFRKTLDDGFFPFIIIDAINDRVKYFDQFWSAAKTKGFEAGLHYIAGIFIKMASGQGFSQHHFDDFSSVPLSRSSYGKIKFVAFVCRSQVYLAEITADNQMCAKRNLHGRKLKDIAKVYTQPQQKGRIEFSAHLCV